MAINMDSIVCSFISPDDIKAQDQGSSSSDRIKSIWEAIPKISALPETEKSHASVQKMNELEKAYDKIQVWKKLPGGEEFLKSDKMKTLSVIEQAALLKDWIISNHVADKITDLNLACMRLSYIPEEVNLLFNLRALNLSHNLIEKIEHLDNLVNLNQLFLDSNKISKIEGLEKLTILRILDLGSNRITKIEGLESLRELTDLRLYCNGIEVIENLENLTLLRILMLNNNRIKEIKNLNALKNLTYLNLSRNLINKIQNLGDLKELLTLFLQENLIKEFENLDELTQLEYIDLSLNLILSFQNQLDKLLQLQGRDLSKNPLRVNI